VPFTVSHAAAVLPLHRWIGDRLPLTALMIGSMAPDFGYFFTTDAPRRLTHSLPGLFLFALPVGCVAWLFYVAVLEKTAITLLPDRWHTRFAHTDAITPPLLGRAVLAILLGALTHLVWDNFTHQNTWSARHFPVLLEPTPGLGWLPMFHFLHGLSSLIGLVILWIWAHRLHGQPARSLIRPYDITERARLGACAFVGGVSIAVALIDWLPRLHRRYDIQLFHGAIGLMSGFFVALCGVSFVFWLRTRRMR
jgi:hypothetical protein